MITVYGFERVNEKVVGVTRDLRVLWTLEEVGLPYQVHGIDHPAGETKTEEFRRVSPFEQIPVIDDDGYILSETGAILLYLAEKAGKLIPSDLRGRAQVMRWCFAAVNSLEPPVFQMGMIDMGAEGDLGKQRRPSVVEWAERALHSLEDWLKERPYLTGQDFTVADILMSTVLRQMRHSEDVMKKFPRVQEHSKRCQDRPAWQRTLAAYEKRLGVKPGTAR